MKDDPSLDLGDRVVNLAARVDALEAAPAPVAVEGASTVSQENADWLDRVLRKYFSGEGPPPKVDVDPNAVV